MLDCINHWTGMMAGLGQIAAAFEHQRVFLRSRLVRGCGDNPSGLVRIVQEMKRRDGVVVRVNTDVLLSKGGHPADLRGHTELVVIQSGTKKRRHAKVKLVCALPEGAWTYEEDFPERGISPAMSSLKKRLGAMATQLKGRSRGGIDEFPIGSRLGLAHARCVLGAIASWAASSAGKWRVAE
jgi:hypothetical protein